MNKFFLEVQKNPVLGVNRKHDLYFFAECARLAYQPVHVVQKQLKAIGFTTIKFYDVEGAQVFCAANKENVVLAFRGTQPSQMGDVWADINFIPTKQKDGEGWVHQGFRNEVLKVESLIEKWIKRHDHKNVFVCGHSLGGAMATVFTGRHEKIINKLFTYGSPRVGNKMFCNLLVTEHNRVVNNNDVVPSVPPAIGFQHHGTKEYINFEGNLVERFSQAENWADFFKGIWAALKKGQLFDGLYDHGMDNYCNYLREEHKKCGG